MPPASTRDPDTDLVVLGASAGGVDALTDVVRGLPEDFPAALLVVLHVGAASRSLLPDILDRAGGLPASAGRDGEHIDPGHIYVAPPDLHLEVADGTMRLTAKARVNGHRPAVDPLFCSAAEARHDGVTGVVLSGARDDGTAGLARIKECGGTAFVQSPEDAQHDGMPLSAIEHVAVDAVLPAAEIGPALVAWASGREHAAAARPAAAKASAAAAPDGPPLTTICPECGGVLTESSENGVPVFSCHVGHAYAPRTLAALQGSATEAALWTAVRTLEDRRGLLERLVSHARSRGQSRSAALFAAQAEAASANAEVVRQAIHELTRAGAVSTLPTAPEQP